MWYYICVSFLLLGSFFMARLNTAYHPDFLVKRYVTLHSDKLRSLLIFQGNPCDLKWPNKKEYRSRMLVLSIVFYILSIALLLFSVLFLLFGPRTEVPPIEYDDGFWIARYNQALVLTVCMVFLGFEMSFFAMNMAKGESARSNRAVRILYGMVVLVLFSLCLWGSFEVVRMIWQHSCMAA